MEQLVLVIVSCSGWHIEFNWRSTSVILVHENMFLTCGVYVCIVSWLCGVVCVVDSIALHQCRPHTVCSNLGNHPSLSSGYILSAKNWYSLHVPENMPIAQHSDTLFTAPTALNCRGSTMCVCIYVCMCIRIVSGIFWNMFCLSWLFKCIVADVLNFWFKAYSN